MRWREGGPDVAKMEAGQVYQVDISLWNTSYVFAAGHRLR
jgi:predicted acyl esterase